MNIGNCSICYAGIKRTSIATLTGCGHTFHPNCIYHWIGISSTCPLCRQNVTVSSVRTVRIDPPTSLHNLPQEAFDAALAEFDKYAPKTGENEQNRTELHEFLMAIISTREDSNLDQKSIWTEIKEYIKENPWKSAAMLGLLTFLCYSFWPVVAGVGAFLTRAVLSTVEALCTALQESFPSVVLAAVTCIGIGAALKCEPDESDNHT
ncbi:ring finger domain-containing protein [Ditylenchus destructor]|uniref:Ring finger domain-containing protein n=1 Tax=Ditylenchus destructor TaxID=166010 RepID=A0AAD4NB89_9BILA|nr:ring finger domain-containing protein [Ditylenchus destructor]